MLLDRGSAAEPETLIRTAQQIASSNLPVLVSGETGTGKETLARVIHCTSDRAEHAFVPFNCTAVPRDMLESQLFGYRKGAFTSADSPFGGVIRAANGGTLFLDEIGDVAIEIQPKLLRFLEHHEVHPLGEAHAVKVDVRIIAATNANLEHLVAQGRFREDLLYRLKVLPLHLPPLRERREEIPALLQHYLQKHGDEQKKGRVTLSDETLEYLLLYSWPGNIRQLANEVRRIIALAEPDAIVTPSLLSPEILASRRTVPSADAPAEPEIRLKLDQKAYLVSSTTLSLLALQLEIPKYLRLGRGEEKTGGRKKKALSANAFEAVIAAIYLDSGIDEVRRFLAPLYYPMIREVGDGRAAVEDPKTALQEYLQARNLEAAHYAVTAETGPEHRKTFQVALRIGDRTLGTATGPTKKNAELLAAQTALAKLLSEEDGNPEPQHPE